MRGIYVQEFFDTRARMLQEFLDVFGTSRERLAKFYSQTMIDPTMTPETAAEMVQVLLAGPVIRGEFYYWTSQMVDVAYEASKTLPMTLRLDEGMLPSFSGFFWFERPLDIPGTTMWRGLRAITWVPVLYLGGEYGKISFPPYTFPPSFNKLGIATLYESGDVGKPPIPCGTLNLPMGEDMVFSGAPRPSDPAEPDPEARIESCLIYSMFALLQQRIMVSSQEAIPREVRRRNQKVGYETPPTVNVIRLRHIHMKREGSERHPRDWSCQWVVRGHWRQQWYPRLRCHKPAWIPSYLKGPDDKPLRKPEHIFAVVR